MKDRKGRIGPYAYLRDQWVSFDGIGMIRHKSEYIKAMGLGGGMIWALDLDDFRNICGCEEYPLLRTINRVLRGYKKPDPQCLLGKPQKTEPPTEKPSIPQPTISPDSQKPTPPYEVVPISEQDYAPVTAKPCHGRMFTAHETNCNQYYLCNQGQMQLQVCPDGLFWNENHCDWPENSQCHPDGSTLAPITPASEAPESPVVPEDDTVVSPVETTPKPSYPGTSISGDYKVICYFTNWAWYR